MSKQYGCKPSSFIDGLDEYTAFCIDEACAYIMGMETQGHKPTFKQKYKSFSEMYKNYD